MSKFWVDSIFASWESLYWQGYP